MASRLFINGRFLTQQITGVQSFARSICSELEQVCDYNLLVPAKAIIDENSFENRIIRTGNFKGHAWEQLHLPYFLSKHPHSVLLNLCNTAPAFLNNQVVTIHDLAFIKNPSWFNPIFSKYYSILIPRIAKGSKSVLTVSESVKNEISELFKIPGDKIYVAGNKVQQSILTCIPKKAVHDAITPNKFFLMVGSKDPRKNFSMVESLFAEKFPGVKLVIAGGSNATFQNNNLLQSNPDCIKLGYTDEPTLRWLYENALGFINPSLYEGYGIPNLEAFAFGCPVICSDLPVFREICGDAANYFDPQQRETLWILIRNMLESTAGNSEKTKLGKVIFTSIQQKNRTQILLKAIAL